MGHPGGRILPVGPGIGATQLACAVISPTLAAGRLPSRTVAEPNATIPGPAGTHGGVVQGVVVLVNVAAGRFPISTVGVPLMMVRGKGGCGTGVGTGAGGWIGAWQCGESCNTISVILAASDMKKPPYKTVFTAPKRPHIVCGAS